MARSSTSGPLRRAHTDLSVHVRRLRDTDCFAVMRQIMWRMCDRQFGNRHRPALPRDRSRSLGDTAGTLTSPDRCGELPRRPRDPRAGRAVEHDHQLVTSRPRRALRLITSPRPARHRRPRVLPHPTTVNCRIIWHLLTTLNGTLFERTSDSTSCRGTHCCWSRDQSCAAATSGPCQTALPHPRAIPEAAAP